MKVQAGHLLVSVGGRQVLDMDVSADLGSTAYVGYTGATGGLTDNHAITSSTVTPGS